MNKKDDIVLNVKQSLCTKDFSNEEIIHSQELKIVKKWIEDKMGNINSPNIQNLKNDAISILGSRGSGKSSFILSLMKEINKSDIECLDLIDPTLFEEKGHIFLTIISEISQRVLKAIEKK